MTKSTLKNNLSHLFLTVNTVRGNKTDIFSFAWNYTDTTTIAQAVSVLLSYKNTLFLLITV